MLALSVERRRWRIAAPVGSDGSAGTALGQRQLLVVTLSEQAPVAMGRTWDAAAFAERDAVLAALGVLPFKS